MTLRNRLTSIQRAAKCLLRKPETDIYLSTLENCGTHWIILLIAYYLVKKFDLNVSLDKVRAPELIPNNSSDPDIRAASVPVIRRSHQAYWFLYRGEKVVVMVRELAESLMSAYDKMNKLYDSMDFEYFIKGEFYSDNHDSVYRDLSHRVRFFNRWYRHGFDNCDVLVLRYEDLQKDTAGEFSRVLDFIGMEKDPELIQEAIKHCDRKNMNQMAESAEEEVKHSITMKSERNFEDYFTPKARRFFEKYIRENLEYDFGYEYNIEN